MGKAMKLLVGSLALGICCANASVSDAPFGVPMGTPAKSLKIVEKWGDMGYDITPPTPNSNFKTYSVQAPPSTGVCAVTGRTEMFTDSADASAKLRSVRRLLAKYGRPRMVKLGPKAPLLNMTVGDFPSQWKGKLPNNISSIVAEMVGDKTFAVEVTYYYTNMARCSNWEPRQDRKGL